MENRILACKMLFAAKVFMDNEKERMQFIEKIKELNPELKIDEFHKA